jgi:hypothetical protein
MDGFSMIILEDTLELATKVTTSDRSAGVADCVAAIRGYAELIASDPNNIEYAQKLRHALTDLFEIAHRNQHFILATRLEGIAHQLDVEATGNDDGLN